MQIVQRACNVLRSVVSNSPISIPSYAFTKLRSLYKAPKEGLTGGQRTATFACYVVALALRVLHYRSPSPPPLSFPLPSGGISSLSKREAVLDKSEMETAESPHVGRAIKEEATAKEILPLFNYSRSYVYSGLYSLYATIGNNEIITLRIFYKRFCLARKNT
ncbi:hypothetical protein PUN28_003255 [Cardiocondyla obscurior]|uniref:Uncharacterized protein n=1 Tax=Cardiocondyla obscurior TaxID=286306 RepID=A0AAW2GKW6_9HYME